MPIQKTARGRPKKNRMESIRKAMNERNLNEGQWEDRKQWSLGVGQRRKTFWHRYTYIKPDNKGCFGKYLLYETHTECISGQWSAKLDVMCNKHSASISRVISPTLRYCLRFVHFQFTKRLARSLITSRSREDLQGFFEKRKKKVEPRRYVKLRNIPTWYKCTWQGAAEKVKWSLLTVRFWQRRLWRLLRSGAWRRVI